MPQDRKNSDRNRHIMDKSNYGCNTILPRGNRFRDFAESPSDVENNQTNHQDNSPDRLLFQFFSDRGANDIKTLLGETGGFTSSQSRKQCLMPIFCQMLCSHKSPALSGRLNNRVCKTGSGKAAMQFI